MFNYNKDGSFFFLHYVYSRWNFNEDNEQPKKLSGMKVPWKKITTFLAISKKISKGNGSDKPDFLVVETA